MIGRRSVSAALLFAPSMLHAQARRLRIGVITPGEAQWDRPAIEAGLSRRGLKAMRDYAFDIRSAEGALDRLGALCDNLVRSEPDVILAINTPGARAAAASTRRIPIVMGNVSDPVRAGLVGSLARPGGNVTGVSNMAADLTRKRLALLREAVPGMRRVAVLLHPDDVAVASQIEEIEPAAPAMGLALRLFRVRDASELTAAIDAAQAWGADGVFRLAGQALTLSAPTVRLVLERRLPAMMLTRADVAAGALMSYYAPDAEIWDRVASLLHRIMLGANPADLPVEQATTFELVLNLRTARDLGLTLPPAILLQAGEVIE